MLELTIIQQIELDPSVNSKPDVIQRGDNSQFNGMETFLFTQSILTTNLNNPLFSHFVIKNGMDLQSRPPFIVGKCSKTESGQGFDTRRMSNHRSQNLGSSVAKGWVRTICG